jgi:ComF family protein
MTGRKQGHKEVGSHGRGQYIEAVMPALPTQCAVCRGWSARRICNDCRARHAASVPRCTACAIQVPAGVDRCGACLTAPLPFAATVTAVDYQFPWSALVTAFKFHATLDLAAPMAALLADAVRARAPALPEHVLPLPLGRSRLAERGMNQSWELARRVAKELGCRAEAHALLRPVDTPHLAGLPRDARAQAIRGAFALAPGAATALRGHSVALVDDVMTTGATAAEAARTLLAAGVASVQLWVFARTPAP